VEPPEPPADESAQFRCGYLSPQQWLEDVRAAVARGEIIDPATRLIPPIRAGRPRTGPGATLDLLPEQVFPFEDTDQLLLSDFSNGQLIDLMASAANDLMAVHGDIYDFVGYWLNFTPHHTVGWAFYLGLENDVTGIGDPSGTGSELFNRRPDFGVGGEKTEGFVMMWDINRPGIEPGSVPEAEDTRSALAHELAHRFAVYLPDLLDGRRMQGYGGFGCYDAGHWNQQVDGQGSAQGIAEWVESNPAMTLASFPDFYLFNSDTGGLWAYTELYLMGFVSPAEMDAGNSEFRYMDVWDCFKNPYYGPISTLSSEDIIAAAGPRIPDSAAEDKHYRTGWIMIHLPGNPPNAAELAKAVGIHEQQQIDWNLGTLGGGTMDNSLFDDCNSNSVPDADDIAGGTSPDVDGNGIPDECDPPPEASVVEVDKLSGGATLRLSFGNGSCIGGTRHNLIYGFGSQLPSQPGGTFDLEGSRCDVSSPYDWAGTPDPASDPTGLLWFLVLSDDGATTEGPWGDDGAGVERQGPASGGASGECGITAKDSQSTCAP
jgi:hypothetical protein